MLERNKDMITGLCILSFITGMMSSALILVLLISNDVIIIQEDEDGKE